jgi:hypothetical protein
VISREDLSEILEYLPEQGTFRWRRAGKQAGCRDTRGYISITVAGKKYQAHRLAFLLMTGDIPPEVDHIDQNPSNNVWSNLRAADHQRNMVNRDLKSRTGVRGVRYRPQRGKWGAEIGVEGKSIWLGSFDSKEEAQECYIATAREWFGEYLPESLQGDE